MSDFTLTIGGQSVATQKTFGVIDPATEEVFARAPDASKDDSLKHTATDPPRM